MNDNTEKSAKVGLIIKKKRPDEVEPGTPIGFWTPEVLEEAKRRGTLPVVKYVWPDDLELLRSAAAAKIATSVANQNAARDPFVEALAIRLQPRVLPRPEPSGEVAMLMNFREYGRRTSYSETFIKRLVPKGLPTVGKHKARRVHVARADRWLEDNLDFLDITDSQDVVDLAKANARKARAK